MGRYQFIRAYYAALRFLARCYYALVNAAFGLLNAFEPVQHVQWNNASSLLFIPAHKAAKLIRQRQAILLWILFVAKFWFIKGKSLLGRK